MIKLAILSRLSDNNPQKGFIKKLLKGKATPNFVHLGDSAQQMCDRLHGTEPDLVVVNATSPEVADGLYEQISRQMKTPPPILAIGISGFSKKINPEHQFETWEQAVPRFPQLSKAV